LRRRTADARDYGERDEENAQTEGSDHDRLRLTTRKKYARLRRLEMARTGHEIRRAGCRIPEYMAHLPTWMPGVIARLVESLWPKRPSLNLEVRQVCFGRNLAPVEADLSDYRVDLYVFLYVWTVNTKEFATAVTG
jgi:hypothetical protein